MRNFCIIIAVLFASAGAAAESRIWTDVTGTFKIEAEFVRIDNGKVVLKKEDGKTQKIAIEKLSKKDQDYIAQQSENPFADSDEDETETPQKPKTPARNKDAKNDTDGKATLFDKKPVPLAARSAPAAGKDAETTFEIPADPAPILKLGKKIRNIPLSIGETGFGITAAESPVFPFGTAEKPYVLGAIQVDVRDNNPIGRVRPNDEKSKYKTSQTLVFIGDLTTGKKTISTFPQKLTPWGVSPDGTKALFVKGEWGFGKSDARILYVANIEEQKITALAGAYEPFTADGDSKSRSSFQQDIKEAHWLDNKHVLVEANHRGAAVINVDDGEAVWYSESTVTVSSGGRYVLLGDSDGAVIVEAKTGDPLGKIKGKSALFGNYSFSPDGTKIALLDNKTVVLWNAVNGKQLDSFLVAGDHIFGKPLWLTERYVLITDQLVDLETQVPIWTYPGANQGIPFGGYLFLVVGTSRDKQAAGFRLPHSDALQTAKLPDKERYAVYPEMEIALKIDNSVSDGRAEVEKKFTKILKDNGLVLKSNAKLVLNLKISQEKPETVTYTTRRGFAPMPMLRSSGGTEITYTPRKASVTIQQGDKVLWASETIHRAPSNIPLDDLSKDSLQKTVDDHINHFEYKQWFLDVKVPKKISNPDLVGRSHFSPAGITDVSKDLKKPLMPRQ